MTSERLAAIVRTDIVRSTGLQVSAGEDLANRTTARHMAMLSRVVDQYDGVVAKSVGDGVWAIFDSATRAVNAARRMQAENARHAKDDAGHAQLAMRIGIAAGDVTFGNDFDPQGRWATEAERLESTAAPNQILCSESVRLLTTGRLGNAIRAVGPVELKGFPEPIHVFEVLWDERLGLDEQLPATTRRGPSTPFVGRERELEEMDELWADVCVRGSRVVVVEGEPGVGKSRLLREAASRAFLGGGLVLAGRCSNPGLSGADQPAEPYEPFGEALRHYLELRKGQSLGARSEYLLPLAPGVASSAAMTEARGSVEAADRDQLRGAVLDWLTVASGTEPILLVLDDLQWAGERSLDLLAHLLAHLDEQRVLLVCLTRGPSGPSPTPIDEVFTEAVRAGIATALPVERFDRATTDALVGAAYGAPDAVVDPDLSSRLWRQTAGNALFIEAVVDELARRGHLEERNGTLVADLEGVGLPRLVHDAVSARVAALDLTQRATLLAVAVLGDTAFHDVVSELLREQGIEIGDSLRTLVRRGLLVEDSGEQPTYGFGHDVIRDVIESEASPAIVAECHRCAFVALRRARPHEIDRYAAALSQHLRRSGDRSAAADYAGRAARMAESESAMARAADLYLDAAQLLEGSRDEAQQARWCDAMIRSGRCARIAGDAHGRRRLFDAIAVAEELGDGEMVARAALACSRGMFTSLGQVDDEFVDALRAALALMPEEDSPHRAAVLATLANELAYEGDRSRRLEMSDAAVAMARQVGDPVALLRVLNLHMNTIWSPDQLRARLELIPELSRACDLVARPRWHFAAASSSFQAAMEAGDLAEADSNLARMRRLADRLGMPAETTSYLRLREATRQLVAGRIGEAQELAEEAYRLGVESGQPDAELFNMGQSWILGYHLGQLDAQRDRFVGACQVLPDHVVLRSAVVALFSELDDLDAARRWAEGLAEADAERIDQDALVSAACCAIAAAGLDDQPLAGRAHALLERFPDQVIDNASTNFGWASLYLAMAAGVLGRATEAESWFEVSRQRHEHASPPYLARTFLERGRLRRRRGEAESRWLPDLRQAQRIATDHCLAGTAEAAGRVLERSI